MYEYKDINHLHLEISSECNAACPQCPRNFYGYPMNFGYPEHSMTLAEAKQIFEPVFINRLKEILINGNFGDIVMCPEAVDIIKYFREHNPTAKIKISTNGGARDQKFWKGLAEAACEVHFCLDGLEDTHSIYRRNTLYSTVISNARAFIAAGGRAIWKFIVFDHNQHQIELACELSKKMRFDGFTTIRERRTQGPIFDKTKKLVFHLGPQNGPTDFNRLLSEFQSPSKLESLLPPRNQGITCWAQEQQSIYVTSTGDVYPCCWTGFYPQTYGQNLRSIGAPNAQIRSLMQNNNALIHGLEKSIQWFSAIESSWQKTSYEDGLLFICDNQCGNHSNKYKNYKDNQ